MEQYVLKRLLDSLAPQLGVVMVRPIVNHIPHRSFLIHLSQNSFILSPLFFFFAVYLKVLRDCVLLIRPSPQVFAAASLDGERDFARTIAERVSRNQTGFSIAFLGMWW